MYLQPVLRSSMRYVEFLVLDEVDKLLQMDPCNDWTYVLNHFTAASASSRLRGMLPTFLPPGVSTQVAAPDSDDVDPSDGVPLQRLFFSATFSIDPTLLARLQLHNPIYFTIDRFTR
uniref:ATP-dependent RNA helicase dbp6 n=1 Tax=Lygus hesperus TaxID=30085 RepID=A0A0A9YET7_LYGHE